MSISIISNSKNFFMHFDHFLLSPPLNKLSHAAASVKKCIGQLIFA